jgi:hypothetical protein
MSCVEDTNKNYKNSDQMVDRAEITQVTNEKKTYRGVNHEIYTVRGVNTRDLQPSVGYSTRWIPSVGLYTRFYTYRGVNTRGFNLKLQVGN